MLRGNPAGKCLPIPDSGPYAPGFLTCVWGRTLERFVYVV